MKKICCMILMCVLMINCGGQKKDSDKIILKIGVGNVDSGAVVTRHIIDKYEKENPNVKIQIFDTPNQSDDQLALWFQMFESQSSDVDMMQVDVIWPGNMSEHLVDLGQYPEAKKLSQEMFPSIIQNNTVDGKLVAMPWFADAPLLYYRKDLLQKYGFKEPPKTWAELETMSKKIQDGERAGGNKDFWAFVWQGNAYEGLTCNAIEWLGSYKAGSFVEPDGRVSINNPNAAKAINMAKNWVGSISPNAVTGYNESESFNLFISGNAVFMRNWPYAYSEGNKDGSIIKDKFDVSLLPQGDAGKSASALGGWQLAVNKYSKNKDEAVKFLVALAGKEGQKMRVQLGSQLPTYMALYDDPEVLKIAPFFVYLKDVFLSSTARPSTITAPYYGETSKVISSTIHDVLLGNSTGEQAVKKMELELKDIMNKKK